jgi:hypothetical protein
MSDGFECERRSVRATYDASSHDHKAQVGLLEGHIV